MLELLVQAVPQQEDVHDRVTPKDAMVCAKFSVNSVFLFPCGGAHGLQTCDRDSLFDGDGSEL